MISIRIASETDTDELVSFIRDHWSERHIFVERPEVFRWQYLQDDGRLNMIMAVDTERPLGDTVLGVLGFIPLGRFDPDLGDRDVLLAIWKVRDEGVPPGLGLRLLKYVESELSPRMVGAIGTSDMVRPIYKVLKYEVGSLHQAAVFNPAFRDATRIAAGVPTWAFDAAPPSTVRFELPDDPARAAIDAIARRSVPAKSWEYVRRRYVEHPWFDYSVRTVVVDDEVVGAIVWRAVEAAGAHLLRVVDVIGPTDWLFTAADALRREAEASAAEYVDVMVWGTEPPTTSSARWVDIDLAPDVVLPNYFSPFEQRTIDIQLACKSPADVDVRLFRADSDQDRPNLPADVDRPD